LAVLNGIAGAPTKGELMMATDWKMSGRTTAAHDATGEPASCPTMAATER
jgi:hypothetical protein